MTVKELVPTRLRTVEHVSTKSARSPWLSRALTYAILVVAGIYILVPVYMLVVTGFKTFAQADVSHMWQIPTSLSIDSFVVAWKQVGPNLLNSALITIPAALISAVVGSINGYVFAKWQFRGSNLIFVLFLFGMFLPYQGVLIPLVYVLQQLGLYGSFGGVIVVHCILGIPICALMFRNAFSSIPQEIIEAGQIDGCGFFGIYRRLVLPVAGPAFAVVLLWQFTTIWNDFIIGVVVLNDPRLAPVTVAIQNLAASDYVEWNVQMAGALIAALPTILVYLLLGKLFVRGLLSGAVKG
jgi:glucose/mannose transport system permease protein